jgi:hypothetical protein
MATALTVGLISARQPQPGAANREVVKTIGMLGCFTRTVAV